MKRFTLSLVALLLCLCIQAQHRSEQEAIQIAQEFFAKKQMKKAPRLSVVPQQKVMQQIQRKVASAKKAPTKNSSCYIINDEENNRFVIVAADERLNTILGYSHGHIFNLENIPDGLFFLLNGYNFQFNKLCEGKVELSPDNKKRELSNYRAIEPFTETEWGQRFPYNSECPLDPTLGTNSVTGCVATAMAQVMKYYKYPNEGRGGIKYNSAPYGIDVNVDFSNYRFDYNSMPNKYDITWTEPQKKEVAQLMYTCGTSVAMSYTASGSGAYPADIAYALINNFGYNPNIKYYEYDYYYKEEWDSIIHVNLSKGSPVLYGGSGEDGGHQFIIDGCDANGLYHINWGWNGDYNNSYFELTALAPGNYDFSLGQSMVCGITPIHEEVLQTADFSTIAMIPNEWITPVAVDGYTQCQFGMISLCGTSYHTKKHRFKGYIGIGVFNEKFDFIKTLGQTFVMTDGAHYLKKLSLSYKYDSETFTEGSQYYIAPYSIEDEAESVKMIHTKGNVTDWYLAKVENGQVKLYIKGTIPPKPNIITGTFDVKALDKEGKMKRWQMTITKAIDEDNKYLFTNFDPVIGNNTVVGYLNDIGNYEIKLEGQNLGENKTLYCSSSSIVLHINEDSTMFVNDTWGVQERKGSGDNVSSSYLSQYQRTEYYPAVPKPIEKPVIVVDENYMMTISCATEDAEIRYTMSENGIEPTEQSHLYSSSIQLTENTVIEAKAFKNGNASETCVHNYSGFVVGKPNIESIGNIIYITLTTPNCTIYYTLDESEPSEQSNLYTTEGIVCNETTTIKAIAMRKNWKNSPVVSYHHVIPPIPDLVINNEAGTLPSKITDNQKLNATSLTILGKLNGTDIKFIREMLADGKLAYLDMENASIVEGGDSYNPDTFVSDMTEDNVIGSHMFNNCLNLLSLKLPSTVIKIDAVAISGCDKLKEISLPESCETIVLGAMQSCENLEIIHFSKHVKNFSGDNFSNCPNLKIIDVDVDNPFFKSVNGIVFSKDMTKLVKYPEGINSLFYTVPSTITAIGEKAFHKALIEKISLPSSLTTIENFAFSSCEQLKQIVIPNSVVQLGYGAFHLCDNLSDVTLSYNIKKIEGYTFGGCVGLTELSIGKNINEIDGSAFDNCSSLRRFYVDDNNELFCAYDGVLYSKDLNKLVRCPEGLLSKDYLIPEGVEIIGDQALHGCKNIEKFTLPQTLKEIGTFAFTKCGMTSITIPSKVSKIGASAFLLCDNLKSFVFPDSIYEISDYVLSNCEKLSYVYIPITVDVNSIGSGAFSWCSSLSVINCELLNIDEVEVGSYAFSHIPDTCTWILHCSPNSVDVNPTDKTLIDKYKSQSWWNPNWRIIQSVCNGVDVVSINTNTLKFQKGMPIVTADCDGIIRVFSFDGIMLQSINAKKGEQYQIELPRGMYIINNKKIVIK